MKPKRRHNNLRLLKDAHLTRKVLSYHKLRCAIYFGALASSAAGFACDSAIGQGVSQSSRQPEIIIHKTTAGEEGRRSLIQRWLKSCSGLPIIDVALQFGCVSGQVLFAESPPGQMAQVANPKATSQHQTQTATFNMSAHELVARYDARLKQDGDSGLARCEVDGLVWTCQFDTASFKKSLAIFKQVDLLNGPFELKTSLKIYEHDGKVSRISIQGVRSDPVNLFIYMGQVLSLFKTLGPQRNDEEVDSMGKELGLMRGDSDPTIGIEKTVINSDFAVQCIQYDSSVSLMTQCVFDPRS